MIGVTASGRTPYVLGALAAAHAAGALTAAVISAVGAAPRTQFLIAVPVGAEVIAGSTRLKAGTAQKLVLNAFSTAVMVRRGRTVGNLMASLRVANDKLRERAVRICVAATGARRGRRPRGAREPRTTMLGSRSSCSPTASTRTPRANVWTRHGGAIATRNWS